MKSKNHMLTIFTLPKPFTDPHIRIIQRNAISSWKMIHPDIEIMLLGTDPGIAEAALEFSVRHIPEVAVNEFGTPLLDSAFSIARQKAKFDMLMYVNADIIFLSDLAKAFSHLPQTSFLAIGRRTDLDVTAEIDFKGSDWENKLREMVRLNGKLHSYAGIDYFIFNRDSFDSLPPFAVGRVGWDNWTVRESRRTNRFTIDATEMITAIHENHGYTGNNAGAQRKTNPEALKNNSYTKKPSDAFTIEDANWKLTPAGLRRNHRYPIPFIKRYLKGLLK